MTEKIIVANWKQNMNLEASLAWLNKLEIADFKDKKIVLCPPLLLLFHLKEKIDSIGLPIVLGAQDFPRWESGSHTGEIPAELLAGYIEYALVGHSERRLGNGEREDVLVEKVRVAKANGVEPIFCISESQQSIPDGVQIVAYEPISAIGTGESESPTKVYDLARELKTDGAEKVLYGGSVTPENVNEFTSKDSIDGVLVGKASLDPVSFSQIVRNV